MRPAPRIAFVTPSYAGDLSRCALLCESLDLMAQFDFTHYVLVANHDLADFRGFASSRRIVVPDADLLPRSLRAIRRPFDRERWLWTSVAPPLWPMSGWHVQQLRKMAIARHIDADLLVMADSDSLFVRPFGPDAFFREGLARLYVKEGGVDPADDPHDRASWVRQAARLFGLPSPAFPAADYINNLVTWRREHVVAMLDAIERLSGRGFVAALGRSRSFSEYQIYGAYVSQCAGGEGHFASSVPLSLTYWNGAALDERALTDFLRDLSPRQIAVCVQSFTGTSSDLLRRYLLERPSAPYVAAAETT